MKVKKFSGELVLFNEEVFKKSLLKSGASVQEIDEVIKKVLPNMYEGIPTKELYNFAYTELRIIKNSYAARYSLKRALRELGPEGYYFEEWISKLFIQLGFKSLTSKTLQGNAVTHEIDVLAEKDNEFHLCECKFRNDEDAKISVTTPMYFLSRFNDLKNNTYDYFGKSLKPTYGWLITNAYFTQDSVAFAKHYDINILSWDYPAGTSLKNLTDNMNFYPVTCLTTLTTDDKKILLSKDVILVQDICNDPNKLQLLTCNDEKKALILKEAKELVETKL